MNNVHYLHGVYNRAQELRYKSCDSSESRIPDDWDPGLEDFSKNTESNSLFASAWAPPGLENSWLFGSKHFIFEQLWMLDSFYIELNYIHLGLLPISLHWNLLGKPKYSLVITLSVCYLKLFITSPPYKILIFFRHDISNSWIISYATLCFS